MISIQRKFYYSVISLFLMTQTAFAESSEAEIDLSSFKSFRFTMVNDNPFLNLITPIATEDDSGPTHGVSMMTSWINQKGLFSINEQWRLSLKTDLYTKNLTPPGQIIFPFVPQKFNEITTLKLNWNNMHNEINSNRVYYVVGVGVGLMNDKRDSNFMAIGQQTAWHNYKHYELTPEITPIYKNQSGDTYKNFLITQAAVGKLVSFNEQMRNCKCEVDFMKAEGGVEYVGIRKGSFLYLLMEVDKTLFSYGNTRFGLDGNLYAKSYESGDNELQGHFGMRVKRPSVTVNTGMTYSLADQNSEFYKYTDNDPIWNLFIEYRWGGK